MPNQLSRSKRRKSLAEHEIVLKTLEDLAAREGVSSMSLMRRAIRELIRDAIKDPANKEILDSNIRRFALQANRRLDSRKKLNSFKREQRAFDQMLLDLNIVDPETIAKRNSIISPKSKIKVLELEHGRGNK